MAVVMFDRAKFFAAIRKSLFAGSLSQQQVDGLNFKLQQWEAHPYHPTDLRWLAYPLATSYHETGAKMWPIAEIGKGKGKAYGKPHPVTGEIYYGRGDVQMTWYENYLRATRELGLQDSPDDLVKNPDRAMDPKISADAMYMGMREGWYRKSKDGKVHNLLRYFSGTVRNDPFEAREIINGDKTLVPKWSNGVSIGNLIKGYHTKFLAALEVSYIDAEPETPVIQPPGNVVLDITATNAIVTVKLNGKVVFEHKPPEIILLSAAVAEAEAITEDINPDVPEPEIGIGEKEDEKAEETEA